MTKLSRRGKVDFEQRCFNCGSTRVLWKDDYSFEDFGIEGNGIVHVLTCLDCDADITYECPERPEEKKDALWDPCFEKDLFFVDEDSFKVVELFFNTDSSCGGTVEHNYYDFRSVVDAYLEGNGDPDYFWEFLSGDYFQECTDVGSDKEKFEQAKEWFSQPTPFEYATTATMKGIVREVLRLILKKAEGEHNE